MTMTLLGKILMAIRFSIEKKNCPRNCRKRQQFTDAARGDVAHAIGARDRTVCGLVVVPCIVVAHKRRLVYASVPASNR